MTDHACRNSASAIVARSRISEVWRALGGGELRSAGQGKFRGRAWWRRGDGWSISLDDSHGVWHDFRDNVGGGILDLVVQVRGGTRQHALKWVAPLAGVVLDDRPMSPAERARYAQRQRELERALPAALRWRRTALLLAECLLAKLKEPLASPTKGPAEPDEILRFESHLLWLRRLNGAALVEEYRHWAHTNAAFTSALVHVAQMREAAEVRALEAYWTIAEDRRTGKSMMCSGQTPQKRRPE
jgi:hypothetical protein